VCQELVNPEEFHALHKGNKEALESLRRTHEEETDRKTREFEARLKDADDRRKTELKQLQDDQRDALKRMREQQAEGFEALKAQMAEAQAVRLKADKEAHEREMERLKHEVEQGKSREKAWEEERTQVEKDRDQRIAKLREEAKGREQTVREQAQKDAQEALRKKDQELQEKDVREQQLRTKIQELEEAAKRAPSDIIGNAGEFLLKQKLEAEFPEDVFEKTSLPGKKSADVLQRIHKGPGEYAKTVIVYDNKVGKKPSDSDVKAAHVYRTVHHTPYVLIVTDLMPTERGKRKEDAGERLLLEEGGILIVKHTALHAVAEVLREQVLRLDLIQASEENRRDREEKLFEYIRGDDFTGLLQRVLDLDGKDRDLLKTEKDSHNRLWKQREDVREERERVAREIRSSIGAILEKDILPQEEASALEPIHQEGERSAPRRRQKALYADPPAEA
jgi:hypothetical protein